MSKKKKLPAVKLVTPLATQSAAPPATKWQFRCMIDNRQRCVIKEWLGGVSLKGQASFDRSIEHLASQPQQSWTRPQASIIGDNIYVIRFHDENRTQHRAFGHFHNADHSAVLTLHGYEKDDTYYPSNHAGTTANYRATCDAKHELLTIRCRYVDETLGTTLSKLSEYCAECRACPECDASHPESEHHQ